MDNLYDLIAVILFSALSIGASVGTISFLNLLIFIEKEIKKGLKK